ncbi:7tm odorant receptor domain-containing protein [Phthorimaea operculella]|nr:7tm odorant receptor domain-containing protein [Phthorimaea operculella]
MELYVIRTDLDGMITNLRISMASVVCIVKTNTFIFWQGSWRELLNYITEADKYERETRDDVKGRILDNYTKYCRRITYFYWFLVFATFVTVTFTPLFRFLSSANYREELRNGTELFPHIFSSWMPIDKYHSPGSWITVVWHAFMCGYGATIMAAYDTSVLVVLVFLGGKLDLLRERSKQMLGSDGRGVSDEHAAKMVRELHNVHVLLIKYSRLFNKLFSPVMFLYVVMCALMLCASAFQLTLAQNTSQKILMAEYLLFGTVQLFMFCWHTNDVVIKGEDLVHGPYESEWWAANVKQRKAIHILSGQFRIRHMFNAGPFTELTLSTCITILKGAYSYYTLLSNR